MKQKLKTQGCYTVGGVQTLPMDVTPSGAEKKKCDSLVGLVL